MGYARPIVRSVTEREYVKREKFVIEIAERDVDDDSLEVVYDRGVVSVSGRYEHPEKGDEKGFSYDVRLREPILLNEAEARYYRGVIRIELPKADTATLYERGSIRVK